MTTIDTGNIITEFEDRLSNVEAFCKDLEIRFVEDIEKKPRINEIFLEERLRALEHYQKVFINIFNMLYDNGTLEEVISKI